MSNKTAKPATNAAPAKKTRVEPELTKVTSEVEMPIRTRGAGGKSKYPFADLTEKGMSFGVKNKTANDLASVVSAQNRKEENFERETDEQGNPAFEMQEIKGTDGKVTKVPTEKPLMKCVRKFFASNVADPSQDPDGASVRVFRSI